MFKIESYLTPIILNHLAKYVKNIRPQDAQVSLWEGEVAFQNLDLRLDVLEQELNLPFEFLSGHIHELSILVPWTKITSEPIKITINTIEFVLKLKNSQEDASTSTASPNHHKDQIIKKKSNKEDDSQQPGGYMPGLVTKIINNIVINCHNIILKYVQEDIVVSMNVQLLSCSSANEHWRPEFIDVNPVKFFIRKLVQISDLTICLDKRNSAGQIDVCQEPILYRCSLELRLLRKYNSNSINIRSTLRVAIFTKLLELNISSMQFPMAMRLFKLCLAFKSGELKSNSFHDISDDETEDQDSASVAGESYLSWAWNLLPSFSFDEPEEEEEVLEIKGHTTDVGLYIETLNFTLKTSEFITDSIVGATKKIRYSPVVRLCLGGIYVETVMSADQNWFNFKAGLSNIFIEPLGTFKDEDDKAKPFIARTSIPGAKNSFLDKSLFDPNCLIADRGWVVTNCEEYSNRITESYLLYRSPMIALDLVQYNNLDCKLATSASNTALTESPNQSRDKFRILVSEITFRYNQTFSNIKAVIDELIQSYDYPSYVQENPDNSGSPKLHPPVLEDYDSLMQNIPLRIYKFDMKKITFEIHPKVEPNLMAGRNLKRFPSDNITYSFPFFVLHFDHIQGKWTTPRDPDTLVHTTCQLPQKPLELLNACYNNSNMKLKDINLDVVFSDEKLKLISIPKVEINYGDLLHKQLWNDELIPDRKIEVSLDFSIEFSKREFITALRLLKCVIAYRYDLILKLQKKENTLPENQCKKLRTHFKNVGIVFRKFRENTMYSISSKLVVSQIFAQKKSAKRPLLSTISDEDVNCFVCKLEFPNDFGSEASLLRNKPVFALWIEQYNLNIDSTLLSFLKYQENNDRHVENELSSEIELPSATTTNAARPAFVRRLSRKSAERITRKISQPEETIHFSSERDEKMDINSSTGEGESSKSSYNALLPILKALILSVEIGHGNIYLSECFEKEKNTNIDYSLIMLPKIVVKSVLADGIKRVSLNTKILHTNKDTFPWKFTISDFSIHNHVANQTNVIVNPVQTTITIALTYKKEITKPSSETKTSDKFKVIDEIDLQKSSKVIEKRRSVSERMLNSNEEFRRPSDRDGSIVSEGKENYEKQTNNSGTITPILDKHFSQDTTDTPSRGKTTAKLNASRDVIAVNLHIDTSPIHVEFSALKTIITKEHINLLISAISSIQVTSRKSFAQKQENSAVKIITVAEESPVIKEFLEMETNSESSKLSETNSTKDLNVSLFCQWTVTKFIFELEGSNRKSQKIKLILDTEDLIATVDRCEDFTKVTNKIGTLNVRFLEENTSGNWIADDCLRIKMCSETSQSPFFNMIITTVGLKNFFTKIGAKLQGDMKRTISEIIISLEAIEIMLNIDKMDEFIFAISPLFIKTNKVDSSNSQSKVYTKAPLCANDLPMLHLDSKGFTMYVPLKCERNWCTVSILKVNNITITPNVENPLQRTLIRADMFHKAAQMGILGTPGSIIEDRQYEIRFKNISAATGNWDEILIHMKERTDNFHNTNPAFEWNNQGRKTTLELREIFDNFTFVITYAPCILYNKILISGNATEFNCSNDFIASLTTDQLTLLSYTVRKIQNNIKSHKRRSKRDESDEPSITHNISLDSVQMPVNQTKSLSVIMRTNDNSEVNSVASAQLPRKSKSEMLIEESSENNFTDSGFHSVEKDKNFQCVNSTTPSTLYSCIKVPKMERKLPHSVSIVAGVFLFKFFGFARKRGFNNKLSHTDFVIPLFSISICQPAYMFTQNLYEATTQMSLFDLTVNVSQTRASRLLASSSLSSISDSDDELFKTHKLSPQSVFPELILETKRGELSSSGVPPPLFAFKSHKTKSNKIEIDFTISKPIIMYPSPKKIEKIARNTVSLYKALREDECCKQDSTNNAKTKDSVYQTTIQGLRNTVLNADHFNFKCDEINIRFVEENVYKIKIVLDDIKLSMKFILRPEKVYIKSSIGSVYLITDGRMLLHPTSVKISTDLVQEPWHYSPLIITSVKFNIVHFDVGVRNVLSIQSAFKDLLALKMYIWNRMKEFYKDEKKANKIIDDTQRFKVKDEYYQDDLRAGAFQFVEVTSDAILPLPYQIQIIKKNFGIICWRYPQQRKMNNIHIYPVPMAVSNPIHIKCRMEYFSEAHESFLPFTDFWLSETVSKSIKLPEREVTAHIWRVVILQSLVSINGECFDTSEEDEELNSITSIKIEDILNSAEKETDYLLNPKVLVGCMRIDTAFKPLSVAKSQLFLSVKRIHLGLQNQSSQDFELPAVLRKFKLASETTLDHNFLSIIIEHSKFYISLCMTDNYSIDFDFILSLRCLDYGFFNMLHLMEEAHFNGYVCIKDTCSISTSVVVDKIRLSIGPAILHSLLSSRTHWEEAFDPNKKKHLIMTKFTFVNRTHVNIYFGQTGTKERIQLQPKRCHLYSFRNNNLNQEITFLITDEKTQILVASPPVPITLDFGAIGDTQIQNICLNDKCLIVSIKKLSSTQLYILIKGQIELISEVSDELRLEFRTIDIEEENEHQNHSVAMVCEYFTTPNDRISFLYSVNAEANIVMRLRLKGAIGKGRTGDIPLRINKHLPWLVKVPVIASNYSYISFWVRILRENIQTLWNDTHQPQKILISIWPIFEIRSMLTHSVTAEESTTSKVFEVRGMFGRTELRVPATHQTDHHIRFSNDFLSSTDKQKQTFNLSLRSIDWNKFFWYDEKVWTVDKVLLELPKRVRRKWPCINEEEIRLSRSIATPSKDVDIFYRCYPSHTFSCTLTLELAPWGLFINGIGQLVTVIDDKTKLETSIESNHIAMLPKIATSFSLIIGHGTESFSSLPIYFNASDFDCNISERYCVAENSTIELSVQLREYNVKLILEYQTDNGINLFNLKSKFVLANYTPHTLIVLPYAIDTKYKLKKGAVEAVSLTNSKIVAIPTESVENSCGISLDIFACLCVKNTSLQNFVSLKTSDNSDISIPIDMSHQFNRLCFSINEEKESISFTASLIEKNGQYFLNIMEDISPTMQIINRTDLVLLLKKSNLIDNGCKNNDEFEDIEWIQKLYPSSNSYYTPQDFYDNFPDNIPMECSFAIALYKENLIKKSIKWSKPIRTDISSEKFLHVPCHGDVKVIVCGKHKTIRISIFYISQQLEFSVKDIRSRLLDPNQSPAVSVADPAPNQSDQHSSSSTIPLIKNFKSVIPPNCSHFNENAQKQTQIKIRLFIKEFKVKLYNASKKCDYLKTEIVALHVDDFMLAFDEFERNLYIILGNLQIDNQLFSSGNYDFPVFLCSQVLYNQTSVLPSVHFLEKSYEDLRRKSMVMITLSFYDEEFKLRAITCKLSPLRVYIEDIYLNDLMNALLECNPNDVTSLHKHENGRHKIRPGEVLIPKDVATQALIMSEPMHLQYFRVEPIDVMLSVHTCVRLYLALDHSPLQFSAYERLNIVTLPYRLGHTIGMHYLSGALFGAGWVVGSLEILGSPSGLARSVTVGLRDFVSMPVQGLLRGPWGFVVGVSQGSASLLRNITAGTVNSVTKLAASVARNLDRLSLDQEHIQRTEALRRSRPQGFAEGFSQGITGLGISILGAVGGLARHTLEARSPVEVVTGMGKGIVGAFTKPISGAAELVALTGQGVLHTVGFNAMPQQCSPSSTRNTAIEPADSCIWKSLPNFFIDDQLLFYHEITLMIGDQMKNAHLFLTSAVFGVMEYKKDTLIFVIPVDKIEAACDSNDPTLINVTVQEDTDEFNAENIFMKERIISFLHSATSQTALPELKSYIDDEDNYVRDSRIVQPLDNNLRWSFYINEHLGRHLLQYLRLIYRKKLLG